MKVGVGSKLHLMAVSGRAKRRGDRIRNVLVEEKEGDRVFVRFEGWNWWTWVYLKGDPHYIVKRGWVPQGVPREIVMVKRVF